MLGMQLTQDQIAARQKAARDAAARENLRKALTITVTDQPLDYGESERNAAAFVQYHPEQAASAQLWGAGVANRAAANALPPSPMLPRQPQPVAAPAPAAAATPAPVPSITTSTPATPAPAATNGWSKTAVPGVAGRLGVGGIPEFSNDANILTGAGPQAAVGTVNGSHGVTIVPAFHPAAVAPQPAAVPPPGGITVLGVGNKYEDMLTSNNPFERRAAKFMLDQQGQDRRQQIGVDGALAQTNLRGQYGLQAADLQGQYGLQAADLQGQYGLQGANVQGQYSLAAARLNADALTNRALLTVKAKQNLPTEQLAARRMAVADAAMVAGNPELAAAAAGITLPKKNDRYVPIKNEQGVQIGYAIGGVEHYYDKDRLGENARASQLYNQQQTQK